MFSLSTDNNINTSTVHRKRQTTISTTGFFVNRLASMSTAEPQRLGRDLSNNAGQSVAIELVAPWVLHLCFSPSTNSDISQIDNISSAYTLHPQP
jgi:hypothetical protein